MMGLTAQGQISSALQAADSELAAVCARYGIQKFFSIGDE
jgi:predicted nucleic acid-binding protein